MSSAKQDEPVDRDAIPGVDTYYILRNISRNDPDSAMTFWWPLSSFGKVCYKLEDAKKQFEIEKKECPKCKIHLVKYKYDNGVTYSNTGVTIEKYN